MFQMAIMAFCGVKDFPTFDNPTGGMQRHSATMKTLGQACKGTNIERCQKFFNVNTEGLEAVACWKCEGLEGG